MPNKINKLPQSVINQIAAGEVIERPASVVKELVDNSIDAGATQIKIRLKNGGLSLLEIIDNGSGISETDLPFAFEPHATSKINNIEDLNKVLTMGFRGEALSTIQSIAKIRATTRTADDDSANIIYYNSGDSSKDNTINKTARDIGTTITVEEIFFNVPARRKFLKTPETEYRKIYEILTPYFLIHPEIHFVLEKDGKETLNIPSIQEATPLTIHPIRFRQVLKSDFADNLIDFFYEGEGIKIGGLSAHPKYHVPKTSYQYIFVNNRPINDYAIVKSIVEGYAGYIPAGQKIPFAIKIDINPELVDVNVHPRKEEVRFINPYRVYSAIENTVKAALAREIKKNAVNTDYGSSTSDQEIGYSRLRGGKDSAINYDRQYSTESKRGDYGGKSTEDFLREVNFKARNRQYTVEDSLRFSRDILKDGSVTSDEYIDESLFDSDTIVGSQITRHDSNSSQVHNGDINFSLTESQYKISDKTSGAQAGLNAISYSQIFNKYILAQMEKELWVIDQHAAAERINYEKLLRQRESDIKNVQQLLIPVSIKRSTTELLYFNENISFWEDLGFELVVNEKDGYIELSAIPSFIPVNEIEQVFNEIFEIDDEGRDLNKNFEHAKNYIIATMSCHTSVRSGQRLAVQEMHNLVNELLNCENPYSCPHGRPAVWKMKLSEIDTHFERSY